MNRLSRLYIGVDFISSLIFHMMFSSIMFIFVVMFIVNIT